MIMLATLHNDFAFISAEGSAAPTGKKHDVRSLAKFDSELPVLVSG